MPDVGSINFGSNNAIARIKVLITAETETYCKCECGKEYHSENAIYCGNCGRKLNKSAE